jgi:hypothetical protein
LASKGAIEVGHRVGDAAFEEQRHAEAGARLVVSGIKGQRPVELRRRVVDLSF